MESEGFEICSSANIPDSVLHETEELIKKMWCVLQNTEYSSCHVVLNAVNKFHAAVIVAVTVAEKNALQKVLKGCYLSMLKDIEQLIEIKISDEG